MILTSFKFGRRRECKGATEPTESLTGATESSTGSTHTSETVTTPVTLSDLAATGLPARTDAEKPDTWTVTTEDGYQCTLSYKKGTERLYVHGAPHLVKKIRQEHAFQQRSGLRGLCACGGFKPGCESGCTAPCTPSHRRIRPVTVIL